MTLRCTRSRLSAAPRHSKARASPSRRCSRGRPCAPGTVAWPAEGGTIGPVTDPEMLSWLRDAITERLELARKATQPPWMPEGADPTDDEIWIDGEDDG